MPSKATTVDEYINELPEDRKVIITSLRKAFKNNLPQGFEECMSYGMIGYVVPHSIYPKGYHCNPALPLPMINIGSQKAHIVIHHLGLYASTPLSDWFVEEWTKHSTKKLDKGKGCLRFKKAEDIPLKLIEELATKITIEKYIDVMETNLANAKKKK